MSWYGPILLAPVQWTPGTMGPGNQLITVLEFHVIPNWNVAKQLAQEMHKSVFQLPRHLFTNYMHL